MSKVFAYIRVSSRDQSENRQLDSLSGLKIDEVIIEKASRLLMNLALLQAGYNIVIIPPVVRKDYIYALQDAQINNNPQPFINFISEMVLESQKEYLKIIERF